MLLHKALGKYLEYMEAHNYTFNTISSDKKNNEKLIIFLRERGIFETEDISKHDITDFFTYLNSAKYFKQKKKYLFNKRTINRIASSVKGFLSFIYWSEYNTEDLKSMIPSWYKHDRLPKNILTVNEIETILKSFDSIDTFSGQRDKTIIEVLYNTGIRFGELRDLKIRDIHLSSDMIYINQRKTRNDRFAPMTVSLKETLKKYITGIRPYTPGSRDSEYLFLSPKGCQISSAMMTRMFRKVKKKSGIEKDIHCHLFRHTFAIHLLKNGCSIRYIKELLGHRYLSSTEVYTEIMNSDLREALLEYHPLSNDYIWLKLM